MSWAAPDAATAGRKGSGNQSGHSLFSQSWHSSYKVQVLGLSEFQGCGKSGNIQPRLPLWWILLSGLWKQCLVNLQRPPVGCPCADKAVICSGGLGLSFSSPEGT